MKTLKRISALLLAVFLIASFSITAFAEGTNEQNIDGINFEDFDVNNANISTNKGNIGTNNGEIVNNQEDGYINNNKGTVGINCAVVVTNDPKTDDNKNGGFVGDNSDTGTIGIEGDSTTGNYGTVSTNYGTVYYNQDGGTIEVNYDSGTITNNMAGGKIGEEGNSYSGNFGTVENNEGTVFYNQSGAEVTNNLAGGVVDENNGTVKTNAAPTTENPKGGVVTINNGTIGVFYDYDDNTENHGTVITNNGLITGNQSTGVVETNNGRIGEILDGNTSHGSNFGVVNSNTSKGTIASNDGIVGNNSGMILYNWSGTVTNNEMDGTIKYNRHTVENNSGTIQSNRGTVKTNSEDGKITTNKGEVTINSGTIENNDWSVTVNTGTVSNNSSTNSNVVMNLGGEVSGTRAPEFNFFGVTVFDKDGALADKDGHVGSGFTDKADILAGISNMYSGFDTDEVSNALDGRYLIEDNNSDGTEVLTAPASVTVTPKSGTKLNKPEIEGNSVYTINESGDKWIISFSEFNSNVKINIKIYKPSPSPTPKPQASSPMFAATCKLTFDLDGGVLDGETELELKCSAGQKITLPEAPTKEGFTFAGWQTEVRGQKIVFEAGEKFTVTAAKTFVALWEEA